MKTLVNIAAVVFVLGTQAADGGCEDTGAPGYSCHVEERGLHVENGYVTDVVKNWCEIGLQPSYQTFMTWIETRRNPDDKWLVASRVGTSDDIPDSVGVPYRLRDGRCQPDIEYTMAWRAYGAARNGVPFDTGIVRRLPGATDLC